MTINRIPIIKYGAKLRADYSVSGSSITTSYIKPRTGSTFHRIGNTIGLKTITLPFDIYGDSPTDARRKISRLDALAASGKVELVLPDRFQYTSILQAVAVPTPITDRILSCSYTFLGIQHENLVTVKSTGKVFAIGTLPQMDCILSVTVGADAEKYSFAGVTFTNVSTGDKLTLDGMTKRVLVNGAPGAQKCDLVEFPYLTPGENTLSGPDTVTVQYYPSYL